MRDAEQPEQVDSPDYHSRNHTPRERAKPILYGLGVRVVGGGPLGQPAVPSMSPAPSVETLFNTSS